MPDNYKLYVKQRLPVDKYPVQYVLLHTDVLESILTISSGKAFQLYMLLAKELSEGEETHIVYTKHQTLADQLNVHCPKISTLLQILKNANLVLKTGYGIIILNPLYIWKGSLVEREKCLRELFGLYSKLEQPLGPEK